MMDIINAQTQNKESSAKKGVEIKREHIVNQKSGQGDFFLKTIKQKGFSYGAVPEQIRQTANVMHIDDLIAAVETHFFTFVDNNAQSTFALYLINQMLQQNSELTLVEQNLLSIWNSIQEYKDQELVIEIYSKFLNDIYKGSTHLHFFIKAHRTIDQIINGDKAYEQYSNLKYHFIKIEKIGDIMSKLFQSVAVTGNSPIGMVSNDQLQIMIHNILQKVQIQIKDGQGLVNALNFQLQSILQYDKLVTKLNSRKSKAPTAQQMLLKAMGNHLKTVVEPSSDEEENNKPFYSVEKILSTGPTPKQTSHQRRTGFKGSSMEESQFNPYKKQLRRVTQLVQQSNAEQFKKMILEAKAQEDLINGRLDPAQELERKVDKMVNLKQGSKKKQLNNNPPQKETFNSIQQKQEGTSLYNTQMTGQSKVPNTARDNRNTLHDHDTSPGNGPILLNADIKQQVSHSYLNQINENGRNSSRGGVMGRSISSGRNFDLNHQNLSSSLQTKSFQQSTQQPQQLVQNTNFIQHNKKNLAQHKKDLKKKPSPEPQKQLKYKPPPPKQTANMFGPDQFNNYQVQKMFNNDDLSGFSNAETKLKQLQLRIQELEKDKLDQKVQLTKLKNEMKLIQLKVPEKLADKLEIIISTIMQDATDLVMENVRILQDQGKPTTHCFETQSRISKNYDHSMQILERQARNRFNSNKISTIMTQQQTPQKNLSPSFKQQNVSFVEGDKSVQFQKNSASLNTSQYMAGQSNFGNPARGISKDKSFMMNSSQVSETQNEYQKPDPSSFANLLMVGKNKPKPEITEIQTTTEDITEHATTENFNKTPTSAGQNSTFIIQRGTQVDQSSLLHSQSNIDHASSYKPGNQNNMSNNPYGLNQNNQQSQSSLGNKSKHKRIQSQDHQNSNTQLENNQYGGVQEINGQIGNKNEVQSVQSNDTESIISAIQVQQNQSQNIQQQPQQTQVVNNPMTQFLGGAQGQNQQQNSNNYHTQQPSQQQQQEMSSSSDGYHQIPRNKKPNIFTGYVNQSSSRTIHSDSD